MELLIYVSMLAIVGGLLTSILYNSIKVTSRENASAEVSQQLSLTLSTIQKLVGDSSLIEAAYETPGDLDPTNDTAEQRQAACSDFCTLMLRFEDDTVDPTWIVSDGNEIRLVRGDDSETDGSVDGETTTQITTDKVIVDYLRFARYEFAGGHTSAKVDISLTYNTDNENFNVTRTLTSAIGRVTAATFDDNLLPNTPDSFDIGASNYEWQDGLFAGNMYVGGNLSVGTTTAVYPIHIVASSTNIVVDADGEVGIGTITPAYTLDLITDTGSKSNEPVINLSRHTDEATDNGVISFTKTRGTNSSPSALAAEDEIGVIAVRGWTSDQYRLSAAIKFVADAEWGTASDSTDMPQRTEFYTTPDGSATQALRMILLSNGNVGIGTSTPAGALHIDTRGVDTADEEGIRVDTGINESQYVGSANNNLVHHLWSDADGDGVYSIRASDGDTNVRLYAQDDGTSYFGVSGGAVAIGKTSTDNGVTAGLEFNATGLSYITTDAALPLNINRLTNDGWFINFKRDGSNVGNITVSGGTVTLTAFTGSHYATIHGLGIERGLLVDMDGGNKYLYNNPGLEIAYGVSLSNTENSNKILGVYLSEDKEMEADDPHNDNLHLIAAVGNMDLWVADDGEDIGIGDLLVSSDLIAGHAMKDPRADGESYIVARAGENINWSNVTESVNGIKHKKISVLIDPFVRNNTDVQIEALVNKIEELTGQDIDLDELMREQEKDEKTSSTQAILGAGLLGGLLGGAVILLLLERKH